jgi:hypothetical protein
LVEYGSARFDDLSFDGDYDLLAVTQAEHPKVESLHFRCGGVPVDLNLRSITSLKSDYSPSSFEVSMFSGRVIHDLSGEVESLLQQLSAKPSGSRLTNIQVAETRHGAQHILDKSRNRLDSDPVLSSYLLNQGIYWLVREYFEVRGLQFPGDKSAIEFLADNEPALHSRLECFYQSHRLPEQHRLYEEIAGQILAPVGGLWNKSELIVFGDQERGEALLRSLCADQTS